MQFNIEPGSELDRLIDRWVDFQISETDAWRPPAPTQMLDPDDHGQMLAFGSRLCMRLMEPDIDAGALERYDQPNWYGGRKGH